MKFRFGLAFPEADRLMSEHVKPDGSYQGDHLAAALRHVTDWSVAIDGGAHVGLWSRTMAAHFGRVLAFEPAPDTFECLAFNVAALDHVKVYQAALSDAPGRVSLTWSPDAEARANTGARFVQAGGDIDAVTIDGLALASLGFLKLDVEGSEPMALAGAAETIARCKPVILFENKWHWCRHHGLPKHAVRDLLIGYGYRLLEQVGCDQVWGPK